MMPADDSVLLICPPFFSYHCSIATEIEAHGLSVRWWNDRPSGSFGYKLLLRLFPRRLAGFSTRHFLTRLAELDRRAVRQVLVVKGEGLSRASVRALRSALPQARFVYYLWDAVENVRGAPDIAPLFDEVATFDPVDAQRFGWIHRPLFARHTEPSPRRTASPRHDWAFIGTLHSDRLRVLRRMVAQAAPGRTFAFGFVPGRPMWLLRHLTDWAMWARGGVRVSVTPMAPEVVREVVDDSAVVVDIEHPRQRGLTMRTIETLLAGRKLATTNTHIVNSDLFDPSRVCVFDRRAPEVPQAFMAQPFAPLSPAVRERYTLRGWVRELLRLQPPA